MCLKKVGIPPNSSLNWENYDNSMKLGVHYSYTIPSVNSISQLLVDWLQVPWNHICMFMFHSKYMYTYVHIYIYIHIHKYKYIYLITYLYTNIHIYIYVSTHVHRYNHSYIHIYIKINIYHKLQLFPADSPR